MTMVSNPMGVTPTLGARVVTADGDELGKVKEVSGTCFKVDASMQPDLGDAKLGGPGHTDSRSNRAS